MGISKIRNRHLKNICVKENSPGVEQELLDWGSLYNPIVDTDDYDLVESSCECVAVEDQLISIPYDLYCLPDLKEILSLDTWNLCLDEEDRFKLSAFLPALDQQTFWLTLKELLNGDNVFFGSPLVCFSHRLKGGFYSPSVSQNLKVLQALEKRKYYHGLRSYHEKMIQVYKDMQKIWKTCLPSRSVEDRLQLWKKRKEHCKPVFSVDLNAPPDDEICLKGDKVLDSIQPMKRTRCNEKDINHHGLPNINPRGVLKSKPVMESARADISQSLQCHFPVTFRPLPKGVLKMRSKSCTTGPLDMPRFPSLNSSSMPSISGSLLHTDKFPLATQCISKRVTKNLFGGNASFISEIRDKKHYRYNARYWETRKGEQPLSTMDKMELQNFHEKSSMNVESCHLKANSCKYKDFENNQQDLGLRTSQRIPSINPKFFSTDSTQLESYSLSSTGEVLTDGCLAASSALASLASPSDVAFPITYQRKKSYLKQNSSLKHTVDIAGFASRTLNEDYGCRQNKNL